MFAGRPSNSSHWTVITFSWWRIHPGMNKCVIYTLQLCCSSFITLAYSLMLRLSNPVYQGRDAICLVQTLKIWPAQLSCLGGSAGRAVCLEVADLSPTRGSSSFSLGKKELSSGVVACICLVSINGLYM